MDDVQLGKLAEILSDAIAETMAPLDDLLAEIRDEVRETRLALLDVLTGSPDGHHRLLWEAAHVLPARWRNAAFDREAPYLARKNARAAELRRKKATPDDIARVRAEDAADESAFAAAEAERIESQRQQIAATVDHLERVMRARLADSLDEDEVAECEDVLAAIAEARANKEAA